MPQYDDYGSENIIPTITVPQEIKDQIERVKTEISLGRKFDGGKLEYGLLPPNALEETVKVLTFGAQKYERNNWIHVDDGVRRYFDALQRHLWAWKKGEQLDPESGLHHLAHAMCCLMFLYERDVIYNVKDVK
jgi:Domain of unknown function (DUF5664)